MARAAIYHFTDKSEKRPGIYKKQLQRLSDFAAAKGFDTIDIYCDRSLVKRDHAEFDRFWIVRDKYDALFVKDYYHLAKTTGAAIGVVSELQNIGVDVITIDNGSLLLVDAAPLSEHRRVATYVADCDKELALLHNDVMTHFVAAKTNWTIADQYYDISARYNKSNQKQLNQLIIHKNDYDLILVRKLGDINVRTAYFIETRQHLHTDIYSLREGFIPYDIR